MAGCGCADNLSPEEAGRKTGDSSLRLLGLGTGLPGLLLSRLHFSWGCAGLWELLCQGDRHSYPL